MYIRLFGFFLGVLRYAHNCTQLCIYSAVCVIGFFLLLLVVPGPSQTKLTKNHTHTKHGLQDYGPRHPGTPRETATFN